MDRLSQPHHPDDLPARKPGGGRRLLLVIGAMLVALVPLGYLFGPALTRFAANKGVLVVETDDSALEVVVKRGGVVVRDRTTERRFDLPAGEGEVEVYRAGAEAPLAARPFSLGRGGTAVVDLGRVAPPAPEPGPPTGPLSRLALVTRPPTLQGLESWTVETIAPRGRVLAACYSPDGRQVAFGGEDGTLRVWDVGDWRLARALVGHEGEVRGIAWSPDGKTLASSGGGALRLWEAATGRVRRVIEDPHAACLAWSSGGEALACGGVGGDVTVSEAGSGKRLGRLRGHKDGVLALAWSPDGKRLASGSQDHTVRLWDAASYGPLRELKAGGPVLSLLWSPDGKRLAAGRLDKAVRLWDLTDGRLLGEQGGLPWEPAALAWAADAGEQPGPAGRLRLWDAGGGVVLKVVGGNRVGTLAPDGKTLFEVQEHSDVRAVEPASGKVLHTLRGHPSVGGVAWSPDGRSLAVLAGPSAARLLDSASGKQVRALSLPAGRRASALAWSPDGKTLAAGRGEDAIDFLDGATGRPLRTWRDLPAAPAALAWPADGKALAVRFEDERVRLYHSDSGKLQFTLPGRSAKLSRGPQALAWAPRGLLLAVAFTDQKVLLWDAARNKLVQVLPGSGAPLAWSPDGKLLAGARPGGGVRLLDVASGQAPEGYPGAAVSALAWDADGRALTVQVGDGGHALERLDRKKGEARRVVSGLAGPAAFSADGRTCVEVAGNALRVWQVGAGRPRGALVLLARDRYLALAPDGHFAGSPNVRGNVVYVARTARGQETLTPDEYERRFGLKNDLGQAWPGAQ